MVKSNRSTMISGREEVERRNSSTQVRTDGQKPSLNYEPNCWLPTQTGPGTKFLGQCFYCKRKGHRSRNCYDRIKEMGREKRGFEEPTSKGVVYVKRDEGKVPLCWICGEYGHISKTCQGQNFVSRSDPVSQNDSHKMSETSKPEKLYLSRFCTHCNVTHDASECWARPGFGK